ncbi:hypothetical protein LXL04_025024 [Taraxacum kok-saghyz]
MYQILLNSRRLSKTSDEKGGFQYLPCAYSRSQLVVNTDGDSPTRPDPMYKARGVEDKTERSSVVVSNFSGGCSVVSIWKRSAISMGDLGRKEAEFEISPEDKMLMELEDNVLLYRNRLCSSQGRRLRKFLIPEVADQCGGRRKSHREGGYRGLYYKGEENAKANQFVNPKQTPRYQRVRKYQRWKDRGVVYKYRSIDCKALPTLLIQWTRFNDYIIEGKYKYGIDKMVHYSQLTSKNKSFITSLNDTTVTSSYQEVALNLEWIMGAKKIKKNLSDIVGFIKSDASIIERLRGIKNVLLQRGIIKERELTMNKHYHHLFEFLQFLVFTIMTTFVVSDPCTCHALIDAGRVPSSELGNMSNINLMNKPSEVELSHETTTHDNIGANSRHSTKRWEADSPGNIMKDFLTNVAWCWTNVASTCSLASTCLQHSPLDDIISDQSSTMGYCLIKNFAKENPVGKNFSEGKKSAVYS